MKQSDFSAYQTPQFHANYDGNTFHMPLFVKLKLTNLCNLRCQKCIYWRPERLQRDATVTPWTFEKLTNIVDQLGNLNTRKIKFSGGEATLMPFLPEIIAHATRRNIATSITTNGTLITAELADRLIGNGLDQVTISLDSDVAEQHDEFVGVHGAWERTTNAFRNIDAARKKHGRQVHLSVACVVYRTTIQQLDRMVRLAASLGATAISFLGLVDAHLQDKQMKVKKEEVDAFNTSVKPAIKKLANELGVKVVNNQFWGSSEENDLASAEYDFRLYDRVPCFIPWVHFVIDFRGYLFPCCFTKQMDNLMGNVRTEQIADILNRPAYQAFRQACKPPITRPQCRRCMIELDRNRQIADLTGLDITGHSS